MFFKYVFVDIIKVADTITAKNDTHISISTHHDAIRKHMLMSKSGAGLAYQKNVIDTFAAGTSSFTDSTDIKLNNTTDLSVGDNVYFEPYQGSCLEFDDNTVKGGVVKITGINIVDDMLFYTDNLHEPKKINLYRSLKGTGGDNREYPATVSTIDFILDFLLK